MDFIINKNSTLPRLKMELIQDGINSYNNFFDLIIFFFFIKIFSGKVMIEHKKHFYDVSDEKIKRIEDILKNG